MELLGNENNRTIMEEMGRRIKDVRISMNLTQTEMADRAGLSLATVVRMEKGESVKVENVLNVFRTIGVLQNVNLLVQEQTLRPTDIVDVAHKRQRALKAGRKDKQGWVWGEDR